MAVWEASVGTFHGANAAAFCIDVAIYGGFLLCNTLLLDAMRRRDALQIKMQIAGTAAFATVILALFVVTVVGIILEYSDGQAEQRDAANVVVGWIFRCVLVLFYAAMASTYARMWHAYDDVQINFNTPPANDLGAPYARLTEQDLLLAAAAGAATAARAPAATAAAARAPAATAAAAGERSTCAKLKLALLPLLASVGATRLGQTQRMPPPAAVTAR